MKKPLFLLLALTASTATAQTDQLDAALAQAKQRHAPVLVDFHAPWCYSCYYMKKNVLTGPEWTAVERKTVVVEMDADAPEGAHWRDQWKINALPSYVVLNEQGQELGRITAEQKRGDFYRMLASITKKQSTLEVLQDKAHKENWAGVAAVREVLETYRARHAADEALAWYSALPAEVRNLADPDPATQTTLARLTLQKAVSVKDKPGCIAAAQQVLARPLGCDFVYELDPLMQCSADLPENQRRPLLNAQRKTLDALVKNGAFGKVRCADQRSVVLTAADLYAATGEVGAESDLLQKAIADTRRKIGKSLKSDRNLADNLRVYLDRADDTAALDILMPELIKAWPDDYVYPYRWGKSLLARGKPADALPLLETAAQKAYGANMFKVAEQRVFALKALDRNDEAKQVVADALKANGPWFPEEAQKLKALVS